MKIIFDDKFCNSDYASDCASEKGRIEAIVEGLSQESSFSYAKPHPAEECDLLRAHSKDYVEKIRQNPPLFQMASLAAGAAIMAAETAFDGETSFACCRPPGHHASREVSWGYCVFCNMGVALKKLQSSKKINSAFVLDFDAHTGDGTMDVLKDFSNCQVFNPYREDREEYLKEIEEKLKSVEQTDIVGVSAGFDTYIKDVGRKLTTFDFYQIGFQLKKFSMRAASGRRFAILEGGYYIPDLGKNVLAFCQGFA
ncbi:MAG: histone deacetylase family protein [Candidatus Rifleibacteriota bacterium]